jgi:hypothetical protein
MQDDEHDAEKSVNAYNKLMDDGMQVLIGTVTSAPCTAVAAEAYENRTFALTPSASAAAVVEGNDNVYQLCFQDPQQGQIAADYIAENYPDAVVGAIYNNADNYSSGIYAAFKAEYETKGSLKAVKELLSAGTSDDQAKTYTPEELCKMAQDYYNRHKNYYPPIADYEVKEGGKYQIHLYEVVDDGNGYTHTATSAWYTVDAHGIGTEDIFGEAVDLTK